MGLETVPFYFIFLIFLPSSGSHSSTALLSPRAVIHKPDGPKPTSEFEHSSIPATVKHLFNLRSNFLTKRDAWAGTFHESFSLRSTPRTDCPGGCLQPFITHICFSALCGRLRSGRRAVELPEVTKSLRPFGAREEAALSEFQVELIQLASQLNGDHVLNAYPHIGERMTVREANSYAEDAVARFLEAGRAALLAGANESAIVTMRPSLTSRSGGAQSS